VFIAELQGYFAQWQARNGVRQTIWQRMILIVFALLMLMPEIDKPDHSEARNYFTF